MLKELFPKVNARFSSLPVLGCHLDEFITWLRSQGYPDLPIRRRIQATPRLDALLRQRGVHHPRELTASDLLGYAPANSQEDISLAALVRSLTRYFIKCDVLAISPVTPCADADRELPYAS